MSNFSKRRLIDKRQKQQQPSQSQSMITTKTSLRPSSSRLTSSKSYTECLQKVQNLTQKQLQKLSIDKLEKEVSQAIRNISQSTRNILSNQKLSGFRQCTNLLTKSNQQWKKHNQQMTQSNSALVLNQFKTLSEEINRLTKDQNNDEIVLQANLVPSVMVLLETFTTEIESMVTANRDRKFMRKASLKKTISETSGTGVTTLRPSSKGKLTSLKITSINGDKVDTLSSKVDTLSSKIQPSKQKQISANTDIDMTTLQTIIFNICSILKNLSANKLVRKQLLKQQYLRIFNRYLLIWNQKSITPYGTSILVQLTSATRHIAAQQKAYKLFLKSSCFNPWTKLVQMFPTSNDLVFNMLRILSKLSASQQVCQKLNQKKLFLKILSTFFKGYKSSIHIVIRVAYIFANLTSFLCDIRTELYFTFGAWQHIYDCFQYYAKSELIGNNQVDKMGISMAAWDYTTMKKQSDIQALMKIVRLIANLFTVSEIGQHVYRQHSTNYKDLIKTLKLLLEEKSNIEKHSELIACLLSCLTNTLYYDRQLLLASNQYKTVKKQLINTLVDFVIQIGNEQICCEALRVVSNLTRMKQFIKVVIETKLHQAVIILLDSTSKEIVYYCLGIIINLLADDQFRSANRTNLINRIVEILRECQSQYFDVATVGLKALLIIIDSRTQNIEPKQLLEVENCLVNFGVQCDRTMLSNAKERGNTTDIQSAQESRNLINALLNCMPEEKYICPIKNCGRKFVDDAKLQEHISRRHKLS